MKFMTFNIQHALDYQKNIIDTVFFAKAIKDCGADICNLNEVRGFGPIEGYTDQTDAVARDLNYFSFFGEAIKVDGTSPYGNALVSKYPINSACVHIIPLTDDMSDENSNYEQRCVIEADFEINGKEIKVLNCHMGLSNAERADAVTEICKIIDSTHLPVILSGDFNTTPDDPVLSPIYDRLSDADLKAKIRGVCTYPSYAPEIKIDYIFHRDLKCINCKVIEKIYSDHFPIVAEFEI